MALAEMQRRPSAAELEALTDAYRRDPGSPAFVSLGEALIALGRPRDAIEIGAYGLRANPQNLLGRMMVAQAFAALHQWKEAQAELLKVVKSDRNNGPAFRLLGEVLLRRGDFDRAMPVLQHAHNLSPADPAILDLLRRARGSQPADPPPPIPTPIPPAAMPGGMRPPPPHAMRQPPPPRQEFEDVPTRVAGEAYTAQALQMVREGRRDPNALARMELEQIHQRQGHVPPAPLERPVRQSDGRGNDAFQARPFEMHQPPPAENPLAPVGLPRPGLGPSQPTMGMPAAPPMYQSMQQPMQEPMHQSGGQRTMRPSAAPPTVRPRVVSARRSENAAHESLRQSAAVGEMYLNNLLTAGLLDVPNVRMAEMTFDVNPERKWGRSSARMFIYLFVIGAMAVAGIGTFYWYSEKQRKEDVAAYLEQAEAKTASGDYAGLDEALVEIRGALKRDPSSLMAIARYAETAALNTLLYGEIPPEEVKRAISAIEKDVATAGVPGFRELLIARAATTLATLYLMEGEEPVKRLATTLVDVRAWLGQSPEDRTVRWLEGKALLSAGDRNGAQGAFAQAWSNGSGHVLAGIDLGDMLLDDGRALDAMKRYNEVLERSPKHPLALLGRALLRAEESRESTEMMSDLSIGLANVRGVRVGAYKALADAMARYFLEDYDKFEASLVQAQASKFVEPRFLARVSLALLLAGKLKQAAAARDQIRWHSDSPAVNPLVKHVDAELLWHGGDATGAIDVVKGLKGLRASSLRGRALFDLGEYRDATVEFDAALQQAPDERMNQVWAQASRLAAAGGSAESRKADEELDRLGRQAAIKAARYPHGVALARTGNLKEARMKLEASVEDVTIAQPNPLEYRSRVALAKLDLREGKPGEALNQLSQALDLNPGYLEGLDLMGQLVVEGDKAEARKYLLPVIAVDAASAGGEVAFARALAPLENDADRAAAIKALKRARGKGASKDTLRDALTEIDDDAAFSALDIERKK